MEKISEVFRQMSSGRNAAIDGLRGVSIILVLIGHSVYFLSKAHNLSVARAVYPVAGYLANSGVHLFFCISGFIITSLLIAEKNKCGKVAVGRFYVRRCFRIVPAFAAYFVVIAVLSQLDILSINARDLLIGGAFVWNYGALLTPTFFSPGNWDIAHTWSLAVEQHFYLLWPWIIAPFTGRRVAVAGLIILSLGSVTRWVTVLAVSRLGPETLWNMSHCCFDPICVGALVAVWRPQIAAMCVVRTRLCQCLAGVALVVLVVVLPFLALKASFVTSFPGLYGVRAVLLGVILAFVVCAGSTVTNVVSSRVLTYIGVCSYSAYLWQQVFLSPYNSALGGLLFPRLLGIGLLTVASFILVEVPFLKWGQAISKPKL